jgi:hypothetical protein
MVCSAERTDLDALVDQASPMARVLLGDIRGRFGMLDRPVRDCRARGHGHTSLSGAAYLSFLVRVARPSALSIVRSML